MSKQKLLVAEELAKRVKDGELIGFGSGSTTELAIEKIAERIAKEGLNVACLPTSLRTAEKATEAGIRVLSAVSVSSVDWAFDGADEVDDRLDLIKGRGAAMLSEKIVARKAKKLVILVSEDKMVSRLGENFAVPVEVIAEARSIVEQGLRKLGASEISLRAAEKKYGPVITEHGNVILDASFSKIEQGLESQINSITGVVDNGLFMGFEPEVLLARGESVVSLEIKDGKLNERQCE